MIVKYLIPRPYIKILLRESNNIAGIAYPVSFLVFKNVFRNGLTWLVKPSLARLTFDHRIFAVAPYPLWSTTTTKYLVFIRTFD